MNNSEVWFDDTLYLFNRTQHLEHKRDRISTSFIRELSRFFQTTRTNDQTTRKPITKASSSIPACSNVKSSFPSALSLRSFTDIRLDIPVQGLALEKLENLIWAGVKQGIQLRAAFGQWLIYSYWDIDPTTKVVLPIYDIFRTNSPRDRLTLWLGFAHWPQKATRPTARWRNTSASQNHRTVLSRTTPTTEPAVQ